MTVLLIIYSNTPSNTIVNAASNISYRPSVQVNVFAVLFMNELKNLTNVVIGKLGKLVHKQTCSHDFFFYFINYKIIIVQVRCITSETKEVDLIQAVFDLIFFTYLPKSQI